MTLTNHNGTFKKCAISSISVAISMLFTLPGALGVFQEYTIFTMENLYSTYLTMGLEQCV